MRKFSDLLLLAGLSLILASCKGGSSGGLDELAGGDISDIDRVTITQVLPDGSSATIEQAQTQTFFVTAAAPLGRAITYTWSVNDTEVQSGALANYNITGGAGNIGLSTLKISATDGQTEDSREWTVKVNGPPVITAVTTGTPKVSVGSTIDIVATATDPNPGDTLTYTWTLNGVSSAYLTNVNGTATLTGHASIVGSINILLTVSDGTASATQSWTAEVNYFPDDCNNLITGQICTIAGSPSIGDSSTPGPSQVGIRISPRDIVMDNLNNYIIADYDNNVVFYWNRTAASVTKYAGDIPAGQLKVIAGTGENASGSDGLALQSPINSPHALAYDSANDILYVGTWVGDKIKSVDQSGVVNTIMGNGADHTNGNPALNQRCRQVGGLSFYNGFLYATCNEDHRVKRINLSDGTAETVLGNGGNSLSASGTLMPGSFRGGMGIFVNADGIYVSAITDNYIVFANHSGVDKDMFGTTALNGRMYRIIGNGGNGQANDVAPSAMHTNQPTGVYVHNDSIFWGSIQSNRDSVYVANNSGGTLTYGSVSVDDNRAKRLTFTTAADNMGGYNGSGVDQTSARVRNIYNLIFDATRNDLVFSDNGNLRLRKVDFDDSKVYDLVGSGQARRGFLGDTALPTTEHLFNYPSNMAYDSNDRILFFMDNENHRVRQVDAFGRISTAMGRGIGDPITDNDIPSNVQLRTNRNGNAETAGLAVGSDGLLVHTNSQGHNVRAWNRGVTSGTFFDQFIVGNSVSTIAGDYVAGAGDGPTGPATSAQLNFPTGIAITGTGASRLLYIADNVNHCIRRIDNNGNLTTVVGICGNTSAGASNNSPLATGILNRPQDVAVDSHGNLIIADQGNNKIRYANLNTAPSITIANVSIAVGTVRTIACNGGTVGDADEDILSIGARCTNPWGVATDNNDRICYANTGRHNVRCFSIANGLIKTIAGSFESTPRAGSPSGYEQEGIDATSARFFNPRSVSFDNVGDLYISDTNNHILRKVKLSP